MSKLTKLDVQLYDLFDDWSEIDPRRLNITKEMCITELKRVTKLLGHTPTRDEFNKQGSMGQKPIERQFGTWNKALKVAGLKINHDTTPITKAQALAELKRVAKQLGHTPTQTEFTEHGSMHSFTAGALFGTWNKALKAAGFAVNQNKVKITKTEALTELKRVAKHLGHTPTLIEFDKYGSMCSLVVAKLFNTWNRALDATRLKRNASMDGVTKTEALTEVKRVAKQLGHTPTKTEFNEHGSMHDATATRLFGTWNKTLDAAELKRNHSADGITRKQALAELKRVAKWLGHTPTHTEFSKHGSMHDATVAKVFGLWNTALKAAGLKLNKRRRG